MTETKDTLFASFSRKVEEFCRNLARAINAIVLINTSLQAQKLIQDLLERLNYFVVIGLQPADNMFWRIMAIPGKPTDVLLAEEHLSRNLVSKYIRLIHYVMDGLSQIVNMEYIEKGEACLALLEEFEKLIVDARERIGHAEFKRTRTGELELVKQQTIVSAHALRLLGLAQKTLRMKTLFAGLFDDYQSDPDIVAEYAAKAKKKSQSDRLLIETLLDSDFSEMAKGRAGEMSDVMHQWQESRKRAAFRLIDLVFRIDRLFFEFRQSRLVDKKVFYSKILFSAVPMFSFYVSKPEVFNVEKVNLQKYLTLNAELEKAIKNNEEDKIDSLISHDPSRITWMLDYPILHSLIELTFETMTSPGESLELAKDTWDVLGEYLLYFKTPPSSFPRLDILYNCLAHVLTTRLVNLLDKRTILWQIPKLTRVNIMDIRSDIILSGGAELAIEQRPIAKNVEMYYALPLVFNLYLEIARLRPADKGDSDFKYFPPEFLLMSNLVHSMEGMFSRNRVLTFSSTQKLQIYVREANMLAEKYGSVRNMLLKLSHGFSSLVMKDNKVDAALRQTFQASTYFTQDVNIENNVLIYENTVNRAREYLERASIETPLDQLMMDLFGRSFSSAGLAKFFEAEEKIFTKISSLMPPVDIADQTARELFLDANNMSLFVDIKNTRFLNQATPFEQKTNSSSYQLATVPPVRVTTLSYETTLMYPREEYVHSVSTIDAAGTETVESIRYQLPWTSIFGENGWRCALFGCAGFRDHIRVFNAVLLRLISAIDLTPNMAIKRLLMQSPLISDCIERSWPDSENFHPVVRTNTNTYLVNTDLPRTPFLFNTLMWPLEGIYKKTTITVSSPLSLFFTIIREQASQFSSFKTAIFDLLRARKECISPADITSRLGEMAKSLLMPFHKTRFISRTAVPIPEPDKTNILQHGRRPYLDNAIFVMRQKIDSIKIGPTAAQMDPVTRIALIDFAGWKRGKIVPKLTPADIKKVEAFITKTETILKNKISTFSDHEFYTRLKCDQDTIDIYYSIFARLTIGPVFIHRTLVMKDVQLSALPEHFDTNKKPYPGEGDNSILVSSPYISTESIFSTQAMGIYLLLFEIMELDERKLGDPVKITRIADYQIEHNLHFYFHASAGDVIETPCGTVRYLITNVDTRVQRQSTSRKTYIDTPTGLCFEKMLRSSEKETSLEENIRSLAFVLPSILADINLLKTRRAGVIFEASPEAISLNNEIKKSQPDFDQRLIELEILCQSLQRLAPSSILEAEMKLSPEAISMSYMLQTPYIFGISKPSGKLFDLNNVFIRNLYLMSLFANNEAGIAFRPSKINSDEESLLHLNELAKHIIPLIYSLHDYLYSPYKQGQAAFKKITSQFAAASFKINDPGFPTDLFFDFALSENLTTRIPILSSVATYKFTPFLSNMVFPLPRLISSIPLTSITPTGPSVDIVKGFENTSNNLTTFNKTTAMDPNMYPTNN